MGRCSSLTGELLFVGVNGKRGNEMITHVSYIYDIELTCYENIII